MTNEEAMLTIGLLVVEARERLGYNRKVAADRVGLNYRTLSDVERGERLPNKSTLSAIERTYAWSEGALLRLWDNRKQIPFGSLTIEDLRVKPHEIEVPLAKASELSTEELLAELNFRVMMMSRGQQHEDNA